MEFKDQLEPFTAAEIMSALSCSRATAFAWKAGTRKPRDHQQAHWLKILHEFKAAQKTDKGKKVAKPRKAKKTE